MVKLINFIKGFVIGIPSGILINIGMFLLCVLGKFNPSDFELLAILLVADVVILYMIDKFIIDEYFKISGVGLGLFISIPLTVTILLFTAVANMQDM